MKSQSPAWVIQAKNQQIVVIGDVILDEYIIGNATRLSREAAIPVLEYQTQRIVPGGACNPAINLAQWGVTVHQIGIVGDDTPAEQLRQQLGQANVQTNALMVDPSRQTTMKTRIMAQMGLRFPQQVARIDRIIRTPPTSTQIESCLEYLQSLNPRPHTILFSDYHIGLLNRELIEAVQAWAVASGIKLTADSQGKLKQYAGFDLVKCNASDAQTYLGRTLQTNQDYADAVTELFQHLDLRQAMVISRGAEGMSIATPNTIFRSPAPKIRDVYDTVGAGDTTIALLTLAISLDMPIEVAAKIANCASGIVVQHVGNYAPTTKEILDLLAVIEKED